MIQTVAQDGQHFFGTLSCRANDEDETKHLFVCAIQLRQGCDSLRSGMARSRLFVFRPFLRFSGGRGCRLLLTDFRMTVKCFQPITRVERPPTRSAFSSNSFKFM